MLQVRNRALHILDYKPDTHTSKPVTQLTIFALALTSLIPSLKLFDITYAWFNENSYNEYYPRRALPRPKFLRRILDEIHGEEAVSHQRTPSRLWQSTKA